MLTSVILLKHLHQLMINT